MKYFILLSLVMACFTFLVPVSAQESSLSTDTVTSSLGWPLDYDFSSLPKRARQIYRFWEVKNKQKAFHEVRSWMKDEKTSPYPWLVGATLHFQEKRYKKCLKYCKKALKKKTQIGEVYFWRGRAYEALKKPMEAANEYRAALYAKQEFQPAQERLDRVLAQLEGGL
ncbi:hypothetical protein BVX98_03950 [bacterium F11]|nr:hypothetical protein BVX98_03950 [bacterium F11]